jgi:hypothetical protein
MREIWAGLGGAMKKFDRWRESVAQVLRRLPRSESAYRPGSGNLAHYLRISDSLLDRFHDLDLAKAAFLHGVHPSDLPSLRESHSDITGTVETILEDRNKLRSIGGDSAGEARLSEAGEEVARHLVGNVLPLIRDARSVALFVTEQLNHLDEDGSFEQWTIDFKAEPRPLFDGLPVSRVKDRFSDVGARARFLRFVVAATAESFGMWVERDTARNLSLVHERAERFNEIVELAANDRQSSDGLGRAREEFVRERLGRGKAPLAVNWEWHHVATLDDELQWGPGITPAIWERRFDRLGYVAVVFKSTADCYHALTRLHRGPFVERSIRDFIGAPRMSGYRALHTVLIRTGKRVGFPDLVQLHVIPEKTWSHRLERTSKGHLHQMQERVNRAEHKLLRVFAHDGRAIDLPLGATVLNFAHHLHTDLVLRLRGATVNRRPVGVLYPLREGDVVWLDVGDSVQPLPEGWESHVPESTIRRLRSRIARAYRPILEENGRRLLRQRLARAGRDEVTDTELDALVLDTTAGMFDRQYEPVWVYRQLGLLAAREHGASLGAPALDAAGAETIAVAISNRVRDVPAESSWFEIPTQFAGSFDDTRTCGSCKPTMAEPRSATLNERVLTIHRLNARCAAGALALHRQVRPPDDHHSFVIETTNRIGIGAEILTVFQKHDVDLSDLAGRRLGTGWGVFRLGADHISGQRQEQIKASLKMPGVIRVIGPDDKSIPLFEELLPPPSAALNYWIKPAPYEAGPPIEDDRLFYGMRTELTELDRFFDAVSRAESGSGQFLFVNGPLRVGKTSIVKQFLRRLSRDSSRPHVAAYHLPKRTKWTEVAAQIRKKLLSQIPNAPAAVRRKKSLEEVVGSIREYMNVPIIIVIDEIVGLLKENSAWEDQVVAFERFQEHIRGTAGVLVIWVGPTLALQRVDSRVRHLFSMSKELGVGTLNRDDVEAMLRAEKMGPEYSIHLKGGLAKAITALTSGNPFWVSHLALRMFRSERPRHGSRIITYGRKALTEAKEAMFLSGKAFSDRVESPLDRSNEEALEVKRQILHLLSASSSPVTAELLAESLAGRFPAATVWGYADELRLAGSLTLEGRGWKIAAPILAEYLRFLRQTKVRFPHAGK